MYDSEEDYEEDDDLDGFVVSDDEDDPLAGRASEIMRFVLAHFNSKGELL